MELYDYHEFNSVYDYGDMVVRKDRYRSLWNMDVRIGDINVLAWLTDYVESDISDADMVAIRAAMFD